MAIVLTHSDIKAFLACRRSWSWSYLQDIKAPEKRTGPLALGTRVHAGLEHYYKTGGDPVAEHQRLVIEDAEWITAYGKTWESDTLYEDAIVGRNCIYAHQEWLAKTGADGQFEVVAVEKVIEAPLLGGLVLLRGKVDVLFRDIETGFLWINDLKTDGGFMGGTREILERSWQPTVYGIAATIAEPEEIIGGAFFSVMKKAKRLPAEPSSLVERWRVPAGRRIYDTKLAQLEQICRDIIQTMERVESEGSKHAYPSPGPECRWCDYKHPCEIFDESSIAAREMLDSQFVRGGRHARYTEDSSS